MMTAVGIVLIWHGVHSKENLVMYRTITAHRVRSALTPIYIGEPHNMKINLPVTNIEYVLKDTDSIVSKTDPKGITTYVNEDFLRISGFSKEELLGTSHNIVRHPDMPQEAFEDLWRSLKAGQPWTGLVKNRCKNGNFYWVLANVTPFQENGRLIANMSVRSKPSRAQIDAADAAYRLFREGRAGNLKIKDGKVVDAFWSRFDMFRFKGLTIKLRLAIVIAIMAALLLTIGGVGQLGMEKTGNALHIMYQNSVVAENQLSRIQKALFAEQLNIAAMLAAPAPELIQKNTAQMEQDIGNISKSWEAYRANEYLSAKDKNLVDGFGAAEKLFEADGLRPVMAAFNANDIELARKLRQGKIDALYGPVDEALQKLIQVQDEDALHYYSDAVDRYESTRNLSIALIVAGIALALWLGVSLIRAINRPLQQALKLAGAVAQGDLTQRIEVKSRDEVGLLLQVLKDMNENLAGIVGDVRSSTWAITTATHEIAQGNNDLSQRTEEQASSLEEIASSMEELTSTVKQNAENARQANLLAASASAIAIKGGQMMDGMVQTMASISASSGKMADIIGVIEGISFQTNILALNAAVEAARAGEQGRGFAVVASEVRSLAQRSAAAAKEIKTLIDVSGEKVYAGSKHVDQAGATMQEVVAAVKRVTDIMAEISAASSEQSAGIEEVNQAITQMDDMTQQNAALVEQAAAAAESMHGQAEVLVNAVSIFRLETGGAMPAAGAAKSAIVRASRDVQLLPVKLQRQQIKVKAENVDHWKELQRLR